MMGEPIFKKIKYEKSISAIEDVYRFNSKAFSGISDLDWSVEGIISEINKKWELYTVEFENSVVAALFLKIENNTVLTKNTPIRLEYQGYGLSHKIKEFYEEICQKHGATTIVNICRADNFRMISLNETHGYVQTKKWTTNEIELLEWSKEYKKKKKKK